MSTAPTGTVPRVDPRIRARQVAVRRAEGRRRLRVLATLLVLAALGVGAWAAVRSPLLDVDHIEIRGAEHTTVEDALAATGVDRGDPLLFVDTGAVARRLEALPWIADAAVSRHLPGGLRVDVREREARSWVRVDDEHVALVDGTGRVLDDRAPDALYVPELLDVETVPEVGETIAEPSSAAVAAAIPDELLVFVRSVRVDDAGGEAADAVLVLEGGTEIRLGEPSGDLTDRYAVAVALLGHLDGRRVAYLDVSAPEAPVVGPGEAGAAPPEASAGAGVDSPLPGEERLE